MLEYKSGEEGLYEMYGRRTKVLDRSERESILVEVTANSPRESIIGSLRKGVLGEPYTFVTYVSEDEFDTFAHSIELKTKLTHYSVFHELISLGAEIVLESESNYGPGYFSTSTVFKTYVLSYNGCKLTFASEINVVREELDENSDYELYSQMELIGMDIPASFLNSSKGDADIQIHPLAFQVLSDGIYVNADTLLVATQELVEPNEELLKSAKGQFLLATEKPQYNNLEFGLQGWKRIIDFNYNESLSKVLYSQ